tara:strand:+ start:353 stop:754 length:402 start_codon:yes stop_codon:yes gene_type:complete
MATTKAALILTSADLLSDSLSLTTSTTIVGNHTSGLSRAAVTSTAIGTASGQVTVDTADTYASPNFIYVKNTADYHASNNVVYGYFSGDADGMVLQIHGGQFAYMPTSGDFTLKFYTSTSGTVIEYMVIGTNA